MIRTTAYKKYFYYLNHFATPKKLLNILANKQEFRQRQTTLRSHPYKYTFDPGNICNLRCPGCHTGIKHHEVMRPSFMKYDDFTTMFDPVKDYALSIALYNWGEPFLNKRLFDIIAYAGENKVGTTLHSNFNHFSEDMASEVIRSGLTHLYLSIDGATQDVYSQYRVKGNIHHVMDNIKMLVARKKEAGSHLPFITWKYLKFPHNAHEVEQARTLAKEIGVTNFEVFDANPKVRDIYDQADEYLQKPEMFKTLTKSCQSLWSSVYIGPDGTVFPCSLAFRETESYGNLLKEDFMEVWNNKAYRASRSLFGKTPQMDEIPYPCRGCKHFLKCLNGF